MKNHEMDYTRVLVTGSLLCSIGLVLIMMFMETGLTVVLMGLCCITFVSWSLIATLHRKRKPYDWFIGLALLNLVIVVPELALRVMDFSYESRIEFGFPRPERFLYYQPDERLFWKLKPSDSKANSLGFPGKEIVTPKPKGVYRILYLGDSVTQQGYPEMAEHFLNAMKAGNSKKIESVSLSISGYSSHQGAVLAEMYGKKFEPDLVVVFYGWNDHWQAFGAIDSEKQISVSNSAWSRMVQFVYHKSRILQAIYWVKYSISGSNAPLNLVRVPQEQYAENLRRIKDRFREQNTPVIFITAPSSHPRFGFPDILVELKFVRDKQSAIQIHKRYNQIVRDVAKSEGTFLLDLEDEFNTISTEILQAVFLSDGIHLTAVGIGYMAKRFTDFIVNNVPLDN